MRILLLTMAGIGLSGFGMTLTAPAWAGPTADQAAAESLEPATNSGVPQPEPPSAAATNGQVNPTVIPGNGLAQDRITAAHEVGQQ